MEPHPTAPIDATSTVLGGPATAPRTVGVRTAKDPAVSPDTVPSRYLACTMLGCIASFGMGLAAGGESWHVPRGTVAVGLLASILAGGLAGGYALGWRTRRAVASDAPRPEAEPLFQVSHEDVIGEILQPLNQLNRELCRDMESDEIDHSISPSGKMERGLPC